MRAAWSFTGCSSWVLECGGRSGGGAHHCTATSHSASHSCSGGTEAPSLVSSSVDSFESSRGSPASCRASAATSEASRVCRARVAWSLARGAAVCCLAARFACSLRCRGVLLALAGHPTHTQQSSRRASVEEPRPMPTAAFTRVRVYTLTTHGPPTCPCSAWALRLCRAMAHLGASRVELHVMDEAALQCIHANCVHPMASSGGSGGLPPSARRSSSNQQHGGLLDVGCDSALHPGGEESCSHAWRRSPGHSSEGCAPPRPLSRHPNTDTPPLFVVARGTRRSIRRPPQQHQACRWLAYYHLSWRYHVLAAAPRSHRCSRGPNLRPHAAAEGLCGR